MLKCEFWMFAGCNVWNFDLEWEFNITTVHGWKNSSVGVGIISLSSLGGGTVLVVQFYKCFVKIFMKLGSYIPNVTNHKAFS